MYNRAMMTLIALALWFGGLILLLSGMPVFGAIVAGAGAVVSARALRRADDMETAWGIAFLFVIVISAIRLADAALRAIF